jgi:hypothetical protein
MYLYIFLSIYLYIYLCLSICLSTCLATYLSVYLCIYLSIYLLSMALQPLWAFAAFSVSKSYTGRTPWTGDQPVVRPPPTHRINAHRHPCLEWDSNQRSQYLRRRRRFVPQTARPATVIGVPLLYHVQTKY